jgi:hypothetical protein
MNQKELFRDNLRDTHWIGEVVDVQDPTNSGRCRIRVFGKFDLLETEDIPWAIPSNNQIKGSYSVPNIGDNVAVYFDNGNIYSPVYKNELLISDDLLSEVVSASANPEAVTSLVYDSTKGIRIYHSPENGLVITTGNGPESDPAVRVSNDGKIFLYANDIFIASGFNDESEPAVKGETLKEYLDKIVETISNHVHVSGAGPTDPITKMDMKFLKAKLNNIKQQS